ncbi:MAG: RNA polymerase sigma factor [Bacteroidales bacterium]
MIHSEEQTILQQIKGGDKKAFEKLYTLHVKALHNFALQITMTSAQAEEIVQEVFVDIWIQREKLEITTNLKGYLYRMLRFKLIDMIRKNKLFDKYAEHIILQSATHVSCDPEQFFINKERTRLLLDKTRVLPEKCRQIFILRRMENYSIAEIAETLSLSPQTVKNQLNKAFRLIKPHFEEILAAMLVVVAWL